MFFCVVLSHDFQPCQRYPTGFLQFFINFHACNQETTKILMGKCRIYCNFPFENAYHLLCISKIQVKLQSPISWGPSRGKKCWIQDYSIKFHNILKIFEDFEVVTKEISSFCLILTESVS